MSIAQLTLILAALMLVQSKPTTESTHALLKRLGFDPVQRSPVNHHSKRVALETNKARYHNDFYNSDTDSKMFVVKLPPHSPYYSHMKPEKFKNETPAKRATNFKTNGKPARIYHWNIPVIRKMSQVKRGVVRGSDEDSKIYRVKILPNRGDKYHPRPGEYKTGNKHKKHKYEERLDSGKPLKYHKNKLYRFTDAANATRNSSQVQLSDSSAENVTNTEIRFKDYREVNKNLNYLSKKSNDKYTNEVSKVKNKIHGPSFYVPAIPKQNSFYKYFTGNGKPKSFYVIEKSKKATRLHRLL